MTTKEKRYNKLQIAQSMTSLWEPMTDEQRRYLIDNIVIKSYQKGESIYNEDENPRYIFYLIEGKVKVYKLGLAGRQQIVRMIKPKEMFGFRAAFVGEHYITGAAAIDNSVLCQIPVDVIKKIIIENSLVGVFFIRQLAWMLASADSLTVTLTQKHIRARMAEALLFIKDKYGIEDDGKTLRFTSSREDIANITCMTTSNAIRTLSALAQDGVISLTGRQICIEDEDQLRKISMMG